MKPTSIVTKLFSSVSTLTVLASAIVFNCAAWGNNDKDQNTIPASASSGVSIASGDYHTIALKNGEVLAWGNNKKGQCTIPNAAKSGVTAIAGGSAHTIALKNGEVLAWGINEKGQCTIPDAAKSGVTAIAGGVAHTIALKNGEVLAWGANDDGQCTIPDAAKSGVTAIAGGVAHTIALKNGEVLAWGANDDGQCIIPDAPHTRESAVKIKELIGPKIKGLQLGMDATEAKACMASLIGTQVVIKQSQEIWGNEKVTAWVFCTNEDVYAGIFENPKHQLVCFFLNAPFLDVAFNSKELPDKEFLEKLMKAYDIQELASQSKTTTIFKWSDYTFRDPNGWEIILYFFGNTESLTSVKRSLKVIGAVSDQELKFN